MLARRKFAAIAAAGIAAPAIARAQKFPSGRVTMIVPFPAGAATDIGARIYAEQLTQIWKQPVIVDNRGGGNGVPAAEGAARAKPDGLTIFATSAMTQVVNPAIYEKLPYDPIASFEPVTRLGTTPFVLLVDAKGPIKSVAELTAKLKAAPGKYSYGEGALPARVASELYKMAAGVDALYVGYKSNPQAIPDVQQGLLLFMMIDTINAKIAIDRGSLRGLFVTDSERYKAMPDLLTAAEAGLPDVQLTTWTGLYVPKGTPADIVQRIHDDVVRVSEMPAVLEKLQTLGDKPKLMTPAEFGAFSRSEKERWGKIIKHANIKLE